MQSSRESGKTTQIPSQLSENALLSPSLESQNIHFGRWMCRSFVLMASLELHTCIEELWPKDEKPEGKWIRVVPGGAHRTDAWWDGRSSNCVLHGRIKLKEEKGTAHHSRCDPPSERVRTLVSKLETTKSSKCSCRMGNAVCVARVESSKSD